MCIHGDKGTMQERMSSVSFGVKLQPSGCLSARRMGRVVNPYKLENMAEVVHGRVKCFCVLLG